MIAKTRRHANLVTLDQARDELMRYFAAQTDSPSTLSRLRRVFRNLGEIGVRSFDEIDDDMAMRYERFLPDAVVGDPRLNLMRDFRTVCHAARTALDLLDREPVYPLLRGKPGPIGKPAPLSRDNVVRIFAAHRPGANDPWEKWRRYAVFAVAVYTGLLRDDILDMPAADIDLDRGEILIRRRKGNKRSDAPSPLAIHPDLKGILSQWLPLTGGVWVFPGKRKIGRWFGSGCKKMRAGEELVAMGRTSGVEAVVNFNTVRRFHFRALESIEGLGSLLKGAIAKKRKDRPSVVLRGESEAAFIRDKSKGVLRGSEHELLSVLRREFPKVLSKDQLTRLTGGTETWRKAWRKLRADPDFKAELIARGELYDGVPSPGYRMNKY